MTCYKIIFLRRKFRVNTPQSINCKHNVVVHICQLSNKEITRGTHLEVKMCKGPIPNFQTIRI